MATSKAETVAAGIKAKFFALGGTDEQWERVRMNPVAFHVAWNRMLGLPDSPMPPPEQYRSIDPSTGEVIR